MLNVTTSSICTNNETINNEKSIHMTRSRTSIYEFDYSNEEIKEIFC